MQCRLCKNEFNKKDMHKKSHIITKHLYNNKIFDKTGTALLISSNGKKSVNGAAFYENYIYCKECERSMSALENILNTTIDTLNNKKRINGKLEHSDVSSFKYPLYNNTNDLRIVYTNNKERILAFKLSIYLQFWRGCTSNAIAFDQATLNNKMLKKIRKMLVYYKHASTKEILNKLKHDVSKFEHIPFAMFYTPITPLAPDCTGMVELTNSLSKESLLLSAHRLSIYFNIKHEFNSSLILKKCINRNDSSKIYYIEIPSNIKTQFDIIGKDRFNV